jgi:hypothetical protein
MPPLTTCIGSCTTEQAHAVCARTGTITHGKPELRTRPNSNAKSAHENLLRLPNRMRKGNRRSLEHRIAEGATSAPSDCSVQNELPTRLSGGTLVRRNTPSKYARIVPTLAGTPITGNYPGMPV